MGDGTVYGVEKSFATGGSTPPSVATDEGTDITTGSGRLNGSLISLGTADSVTVSFVWGTASYTYPNQTTGQILTGAGTYCFELSGLMPGTTYYYKAMAVGDGMVYGMEKSFTTGTTLPATQIPSVTTGDASR